MPRQRKTRPRKKTTGKKEEKNIQELLSKVVEKPYEYYGDQIVIKPETFTKDLSVVVITDFLKKTLQQTRFYDNIVPTENMDSEEIRGYVNNVINRLGFVYTYGYDPVTGKTGRKALTTIKKGVMKEILPTLEDIELEYGRKTREKIEQVFSPSQDLMDEIHKTIEKTRTTPIAIQTLPVAITSKIPATPYNIYSENYYLMNYPITSIDDYTDQVTKIINSIANNVEENGDWKITREGEGKDIAINNTIYIANKYFKILEETLRQAEKLKQNEQRRTLQGKNKDKHGNQQKNATGENSGENTPRKQPLDNTNNNENLGKNIGKNGEIPNPQQLMQLIQQKIQETIAEQKDAVSKTAVYDEDLLDTSISNDALGKLMKEITNEQGETGGKTTTIKPLGENEWGITDQDVQEIIQQLQNAYGTNPYDMLNQKAQEYDQLAQNYTTTYETMNVIGKTMKEKIEQSIQQTQDVIVNLVEQKQQLEQTLKQLENTPRKTPLEKQETQKLKEKIQEITDKIQDAKKQLKQLEKQLKEHEQQQEQFQQLMNDLNAQVSQLNFDVMNAKTMIWNEKQIPQIQEEMEKIEERKKNLDELVKTLEKNVFPQIEENTRKIAKQTKQLMQEAQETLAVINDVCEDEEVVEKYQVLEEYCEETEEDREEALEQVSKTVENSSESVLSMELVKAVAEFYKEINQIDPEKYVEEIRKKINEAIIETLTEKETETSNEETNNVLLGKTEDEAKYYRKLLQEIANQQLKLSEILEPTILAMQEGNTITDLFENLSKGVKKANQEIEQLVEAMQQEQDPVPKPLGLKIIDAMLVAYKKEEDYLENKSRDPEKDALKSLEELRQAIGGAYIYEANPLENTKLIPLDPDKIAEEILAEATTRSKKKKGKTRKKT